jgi:hypothetical protein
MDGWARMGSTRPRCALTLMLAPKEADKSPIDDGVVERRFDLPIGRRASAIQRVL